nr:hypothetical protein [Tanacetum cinerariifolium]
MAILVISVSSDSSEDSIGTPAGRVILFGSIPTTIPDTTPVIAPPTTQIDTIVIPTEIPTLAPTIPPSPDYTPASPDYSPASETESDPSEDPSSGHIPPVLAVSPFLSSDDDTTDSDTPDTLPSPTHDTPFTEITAATQRSLVIPRRRVMILAPRHPIPHGRPYRYHPNGPVHMMTARKRVRPLPVQKLSVRHSVDYSSSDSSSRHSLSDHSSPDLHSTSTGTSRKRRKSPMTSVLVLPLVSGALSLVRADLIPSPKRVSDIGYLADVKVGPRETRVERVMHPVMPEDIQEPAQEGATEVTYKTLGDLVQRFHHHTQAIPVHRVQVIEGVQREQGHRIIGVVSAVTALTKRVAELESVNRRLRGTASVKSQRVDRLQRGMSRMKMPSTRSRASMTHEEVEELVARRVAEEMEARETTRNLETLNENEEEQECENGENNNGGNEGNGNKDNGGNEGNGNGKNEGNGNHGMNYGGFMPMAREFTFQDFFKCKLHTFSRTKGIVGLTRWFEKIETVFNITNCPLSVDVAYAIKWAGLMKLMTEVYCPRNEVQKIETELWNLTVKGNDLTSYTQRLQDVIRIANQLMDKKLQGYAARSVENKRRMECNSMDNRGQQPSFKRQTTTGQNVARAYTAGNNERKGFVGSFPYCNKCRLHHEGLCTIRCGKCKKIRLKVKFEKNESILISNEYIHKRLQHHQQLFEHEIAIPPVNSFSISLFTDVTTLPTSEIHPCMLAMDFDNPFIQNTMKSLKIYER